MGGRSRHCGRAAGTSPVLSWDSPSSARPRRPPPEAHPQPHPAHRVPGPLVAQDELTRGPTVSGSCCVLHPPPPASGAQVHLAAMWGSPAL